MPVTTNRDPTDTTFPNSIPNFPIHISTWVAPLPRLRLRIILPTFLQYSPDVHLMSGPSGKLENAASAAPLSATACAPACAPASASASALPGLAAGHGHPESGQEPKPEPGSEPAPHILHPANRDATSPSPSPFPGVLGDGVGLNLVADGNVATGSADAAFVPPVEDSVEDSVPVPVSLPVHPAAHVLPSVVPGIPESNHASTTPTVPSAVDQDSDKKSRPPMTSLRSSGPSLLTQALASARGILHSPPALQVEHRRPEEKSVHSSGGATGNALKTPLGTPIGQPDRDPHNEIASRGEGVPLMPRVRSHDSVTAPVRTNSIKPASFTSPIGVVAADNSLSAIEMPGRTIERAGLNGYRDMLLSTKDRPRSLERTEKEIKTQQLDVNGGNSTNLGDTSLSHVDKVGDKQNLALDKDNSDTRVQYRTWRADRTLSLGPEKAWSIGKGDLAGAEPGQVEKSITEALAGVEPTRSRKASHSLRFFKEGLPDEKGKRKDTKRKEDLATYKEQNEGSQKNGVDTQQSASASPTYFQDIVPFPTDPVCQSAGSTVESPLEDTQVTDYFGVQPQADDEAVARQLPPILEQRNGKPAETKLPSTLAAAECNGLRRESEDETVTTGTPEEGDDSSEENISSAFFVPHQEAPEAIKPVVNFGRPLPVHRQSIVKDVSPWLVKADEPEVENRSLDQVSDAESEQVAQNNGCQIGDDFAIEEEILPHERPQTVPGRLSRPVSQYYDDQVHDHQHAPKSPLEAIELIPYKHQVGGHTTLWRFSKRAVCKQLNNSENKFYENIERYHRDLLPFLPR